jgi:hypothetical protein
MLFVNISPVKIVGNLHVNRIESRCSLTIFNYLFTSGTSTLSSRTSRTWPSRAETWRTTRTGREGRPPPPAPRIPKKQKTSEWGKIGTKLRCCSVFCLASIRGLCWVWKTCFPARQTSCLSDMENVARNQKCVSTSFFQQVFLRPGVQRRQQTSIKGGKRVFQQQRGGYRQL